MFSGGRVRDRSRRRGGPDANAGLAVVWGVILLNCGSSTGHLEFEIYLEPIESEQADNY
jgi:hypothetical protein